jgi:predicted hotdog family 3-hydroxylacyl-ACP dehydratase
MNDDGFAPAIDVASDAPASVPVVPPVPRRIGADEIYARIPHAGAMRLLDAVLSWDEKSIHCSATSHADRQNPLGDRGVLRNVHALEYAAQAIAVHGSLLLSDDPSSSAAALKLVYVGTFRDVDMKSPTLEPGEGAPLDIRAELYAAVRGAWSYGFKVTSRGATMVRGQATVVVPGEAG